MIGSESWVSLFSRARMLLEKFGEDYEEYRERTKKLLPSERKQSLYVPWMPTGFLAGLS